VAIVVRGSHIEAITPMESFDLPDLTRRIDLPGRYVIPGLIDAHVHAPRWALPRYLAWGVTTVRDVHGQMDSVLALRAELRSGKTPGPRMYAAGAMIDGVPTTYPDAIGVTDEESARKAVDKVAIVNADLAKLYTRITPDLFRAIADEATQLHIPLTAHLGLTDAVTAAGFGVRSIEHLSGVPEAASANPAPFYEAHRAGFFAGWTYFERSWAGLDSAALAHVATTLADKHVILVPTLILHETFSRLDDPATASRPEFADVPAAEKARWNVPDMMRRAGWATADYEAFRRSRGNQDLFLREFRGAGGRIVTGTDATNQLLIPGESIHGELELLVKVGLTASDALGAATQSAARLLGVDSVGVLVPGKVADLVILKADPLADIRNTRSIQSVMLGGRLMPADSIRKSW
jgi:imidazolonepropionase-like amidohydrolase